jgi:DNA polymerase-1
MEKKTLVVIDGNSLLHRAFYALPFLTTKTGEPTGAIYGFLLSLFKAIKELNPAYIVCCFDTPSLTFRQVEFKEYKAKRPETPKDLRTQIPKVKEILKTLNISVFEKEGYEADDLIYTICKKAQRKEIYPPIDIYILTGDFDNLQLVSENVKVYFLTKGVKETTIYDPQRVFLRFNITPSQIVDFKALAGDPSDNIPGVTGIGKKRAVYLLKEFKTLENLYKELEENSPKAQKIGSKIKETLLKYKEQAFLSKSLASFKEAPIDFHLNDFYWKNFDREKFLETLKNYEFTSLINRFLKQELIP